MIASDPGGSIPRGGPIEYFSFKPIKAVVCAILSGMVYIKDPLLLIEKNSLCNCGSWFPLTKMVLYGMSI